MASMALGYGFAFFSVLLVGCDGTTALLFALAYTLSYREKNALEDVLPGMLELVRGEFFKRFTDFHFCPVPSFAGGAYRNKRA